jgi:hypothetical protein
MKAYFCIAVVLSVVTFHALQRREAQRLDRIELRAARTPSYYQPRAGETVGQAIARFQRMAAMQPREARRLVLADWP